MATAIKRPYNVFRVVRTLSEWEEPKEHRTFAGSTWATSPKKAAQNVRFRKGAKYAKEVIDGVGYTEIIEYLAEAQ